MARRSVGLAYHREQAFEEPCASAVHVIEARKDAAVPNEAECRLPGVGKGAGAVCGGHVARNMRIALVRKSPVVENESRAVEGF